DGVPGPRLSSSDLANPRHHTSAPDGFRPLRPVADRNWNASSTLLLQAPFGPRSTLTGPSGHVTCRRPQRSSPHSSGIRCSAISSVAPRVGRTARPEPEAETTTTASDPDPTSGRHIELSRHRRRDQRLPPLRKEPHLPFDG